MWVFSAKLIQICNQLFIQIDNSTVKNKSFMRIEYHKHFPFAIDKSDKNSSHNLKVTIFSMHQKTIFIEYLS